MKPRILPTARLSLPLAAALAALLAVPAAFAAGPYYWDGNNNSSNFGTASGTWAAPTAGTLTAGWSANAGGTDIVNGNSVTTGTGDTLNFGNGAAGLGAGTITVSGTVDAGNMTFASGSGAIVLSGGTINLAATETITFNNAASYTISSILAGAATSLNVANSNSSANGSPNGSLTLSGANTYTGVTTVGNGTNFSQLIVAHNSALGTTAGGTVIKGNSGGARGFLNSGTNLKLAAGVTVTGEALTMDATLGRTALLTDAVGTQTWDGNITASGGALGQAFWAEAAGSNLVIGSDSTDTITTDGSLLILRGSSGTGTLNSTISGTGTSQLSKTQGNTWTITGTNNSYTGATNFLDGVLSFAVIADSGVNSSIGAGSSITFGQNATTNSSPGTLRFTGASGGSSNRSLSIGNGPAGGALNGSALIENTVAGQTLTLSGNLTTAAPGSASTLTVQGAGNGVLSGNITGSPAMVLVKNGTGTWTLSGANTYTGATTIQAGRLVAGVSDVASTSGAFGKASSAIVLGNGSTLVGDAPTLLINGAFTVGRNITVGSVAAAGIAYNATIGGSNTSGTSTYTGNITLNTTANSYTATLQAATGGTVEFKTGTWTTNNKAIRIGSSGNTGTVMLSNNIATTGGISVNYGTLAMNSAFTGGNMTVASGATLKGTGSIAGPVIVDGILSPGASIESLTTGALTLNNGSTFAYEMHSTSVTADLLKVSGDVNLNGTVNLTLDDLAAPDAAFAPGTKFSLINYTGSLNGGFFYGVALGDGDSFLAGLNNWTITYGDSEGGVNFLGEYFGGADKFVNLTLTAIPEPGSWLALGCLIGSGAFLRRRKNR